MEISGVGQDYYQSNVTTMENTKNVSNTEKSALEAIVNYIGVDVDGLLAFESSRERRYL